MRINKPGWANFRVVVPHGNFGRRMILSERDIKRYERIKKGDVLPTYQELYGERRLTELDAPRMRTAQDYFLTFCGNRRIDANLAGKFPLLASFLEEYRASASTHDLSEAKLLASIGAPEEVICAAIYLPKHFNWYYSFGSLKDEITDCSERLGIKAGRLDRRLDRIGKMIADVRRARGVGLAELTRVREFSSEIQDYHDSECKLTVNDEQVLNLTGMMRKLLKSRGSKMLFAATKLKQMLDAASNPGTASEMLEMEYFFQVLPVVEELNIQYLSEKLKDAFFSVFNPELHGKISRWFMLYFQGSHEHLERKLENVARLLQEVGIRTGLLPKGTVIKWRVKTPFSIAEKMLNEKRPDGSLPLLHDILGLRIVVPEREDVASVIKLLDGTFKTVKQALLGMELKYTPPQDPQFTENFDFESVYFPLESKYWYLAAMNRFISEELPKRGYVDGVKDGFQNQVRVAYYHKVMTTYDDSPMEVQITTREMEEKNEEQYPHWAYKYDRQLRLGKWAESIKAADLQAERPGLYVVKMDEQERKLWVELDPADNQGFVARPGEVSLRWFMRKKYMRSKMANRPKKVKIDNGFVLFKPSPEHTWDRPGHENLADRMTRLDLYVNDLI